MKVIFIFAINGYQAIVSPFLHSLVGVSSACRYQVSCSEFAKKAILKKGAIQGAVIAFQRIVSCNPWNNSLVDIS